MMHRKSSKVAATLIILMLGQMTQIAGDAQSRRRSSRENETRASIESVDSSAYSMDLVCQNLSSDSLGTVPIDEMAAQDPLPVNDRRVAAAKQRAERLLPVAKKLLPAALKRLARNYGEDTSDFARITARVSAVDRITPDIEAHDNAFFGNHNPREIVFGTVFLAGLRSDEAMIAVIAHELTHVVDGPGRVLQNLFMRISRQASDLGGISVQRAQGVELGCDLAGLYVLQDYIAHTSSKEPKSRRMARAFQKNCVSLDLADATHLSPRTTQRLLFMLEPNAIGTIEAKQAGSMQSSKVGRAH